MTRSIFEIVGPGWAACIPLRIRANATYLPMVVALAVATTLWSVSSWGYYVYVDLLGLENGYDEVPVLFAAYYLAWTAIALIVFRQPLARGLSRPMIAGHTAAMLPLLLCFGLFVSVVLPLFPDVSIYRAPANPPDFMFASAWYYLPKSADILFQQVIVAAIVRRADSLGISLWSIAIAIAILFGGFHLTLTFEGFSPFYVARFTVAASLFGLIVPYLYLRTRHGFRWAYGLHWSFYALDAVVTHLMLAVPPWA